MIDDKTQALLDFVTKQRDEYLAELEDEQLQSAMLLQTIRQRDEQITELEDYLAKVRGQISKFYDLKREYDKLNPALWKLVGISIEHGGRVDIDAIEQFIRRSLRTINTLE